jgi:hypothetical protein
MTCPDYSWCKERLGLDPTHWQHGFEPLCWRCKNYDWIEAQEERIGKPPEETPVYGMVLRGELNQLKGELMYITNKINEHIDKKKKKESTYKGIDEA